MDGPTRRVKESLAEIATVPVSAVMLHLLIWSGVDAFGMPLQSARNKNTTGEAS